MTLSAEATSVILSVILSVSASSPLLPHPQVMLKGARHGVTISITEWSCGGEGGTNKQKPLKYPGCNAPWVPMATKQK